MNILSQYEYSCHVLNINVNNENEITESLLKHKYHKCCLQHHPDKNSQKTTIKFLEISCAYEYLGKYMGFIDDDDYDEDEDEDDEDNKSIVMKKFIQKVSEYTTTVIPYLDYFLNPQSYKPEKNTDYPD